MHDGPASVNSPASIRAWLAWALAGLASVKLLVDSLNGALLREGVGGPSASAVFGFVLATVMFLYLSARTRVLFLLVPMSWLILVLLTLSHSQIQLSFPSRWALNSSFILLSFLAFRQMLASDPRGLAYCVRIAAVSFIILLANLVAGAAGAGTSQYAGGIGAIGFLYAGNEMSVALIAAVAVLSFYFVTRRRLAIFYLLLLPTAVAAAVLKATKTAMIGMLLVMLIIPLVLRGRRLGWRGMPHVMKPSRMLLLLAAAIPLMLFGAYELGLFERVSYWSQRVDLITLLFSHRNVHAAQAIDYARNFFGPLQFFFGAGASWTVATAGHITEIDPVDFFMTYGFVGLTLAYLPFILAIGACALRLAGDRQTASETRFCLAAILLLVLVSATAGHVLNSGTASVLLGVLLALGSVRRFQAVAYVDARQTTTPGRDPRPRSLPCDTVPQR